MSRWPTVPLGDVCTVETSIAAPEEIRTGETYVGLENMKPGGGFIGISSVDAGKLRSNKYRFTVEHILFGKLRPYLAKVCRPDFSGICSTDILTIKPTATINKDFLYWFLKSPDVLEMATDRSTGATLPRVSPGTLMSFEIPLPSLEEQKRIVALLDATFAKIATAEEKHVRELQSELPELLEGSLRALFVVLESQHPIEKLGKILKIARGGSPRPISKYITDEKDGVNWIKISDATASHKYIYKTAQKIKSSGVSRSRMVYIDDFILSNSMSFGRPYIMKTDGCIHDGWLVFRDEEKRMHQDFLYYLLGSGFMYKKFSQLAAGSTVQNLNSSLVATLEIPVPPIQVQTDIAERASVIKAKIFEAEKLVKAKCDRFIELQQSVLRRAFEGAL